MGEPVTGVINLESVIGHWIRFVGDGIDIFGVVIIVIGIPGPCRASYGNTWKRCTSTNTRFGSAGRFCSAPRNPRRGRHRQDDRSRAHIREHRRAGRPRSHSHVSQLDTCSRDRGQMAMAREQRTERQRGAGG
jgi:hypothetical protein